MKMDIEEQQRFYLHRKNLFCSQFTLYIEDRISTIQIKVLGAYTLHLEELLDHRNP